MKVQYGKWIYKRPEDVVRQFDRYESTIETYKTRLDLVREWATAVLEKHHPYVLGRIDLSGSTPENRKANLVKAIDRNLFCAECRTSWPCKKIDELKFLENLADGYYDKNEVSDSIAKAEEKIAAIKPREDTQGRLATELYL